MGEIDLDSEIEQGIEIGDPSLISNTTSEYRPDPN